MKQEQVTNDGSQSARNARSIGDSSGDGYSHGLERQGTVEDYLALPRRAPTERHYHVAYTTVGDHFDDAPRQTRHREGLIRWRQEHGVPDVGGPAWRTKDGHQLKNQAYYATLDQNLWNDPTFAGPKTWKGYHGPKLRSDAPLMERLDKLEEDQEKWDAKRAYVNNVRVQNLDRFYQKKIENEQKEMASQWAPHNRTRGEIHDKFKGITEELDSMPLTELKKVLTHTVLKNDREGIRSIARKIQAEEMWKESWKQAELDRRDEIRQSMEHRMSYNAMVCELSGQPPRPRDLNHTLPNDCTPRLEELAKHKEEHRTQHITHATDFKGMYHVDNPRALEARFPGTGHDLSKEFLSRIKGRSDGGWPPSPPGHPPTPTFTGQRDTIMLGGKMKRNAVPISKPRLLQVAERSNDLQSLMGVTEQFDDKSAPPPPSQRHSILAKPLVNDISHMLHLTQSSPCPVRTKDSMASSRGMEAKVDMKPKSVGPGLRKVYYEVISPTVEEKMERPGWRPRRGLHTEATTGASSTSRQPSKTIDEASWPPPRSRPVHLYIGAAKDLPNADRSGHSDPYVACQVLGKPRSRVKTHVVEDTECPVFNETFTIEGWCEGDGIEFTIFDKDIAGADDLVAAIVMSPHQFYPDGFDGVLPLHNIFSGDEKASATLHEFNLAQQPTIGVKVFVPPRPEGQQPPSHSDPPVHMPGVKATTQNVCRDLDEFETKTTPVERLGNFWMSLPTKTTARSSN